MNGKTARYYRPIKILFVILCISVLIILMLGFAPSPVTANLTASSPMDPFRAVENGNPMRANILNITGESEYLNEAEHMRKFVVLPANSSLSLVLVLSFCLFTVIYFAFVDFTPTSNNIKLNI